MNSTNVREFLHQKNWHDNDSDWRFVHLAHPYAIIVSGDEVEVTLREHFTEGDDGQNGEQIFNFRSLNELQGWYENNIGE
jgi:hypothetical protein